MGDNTSAGITNHIDLRVLTRGVGIDYDARSLWEDATPVEVEGHVYTEARYNDKTNVILLRKGDKLVTLLRAENEEFSELHSKATCENCGHQQVDAKPGESCNTCYAPAPRWIA